LTSWKNVSTPKLSRKAKMAPPKPKTALPEMMAAMPATESGGNRPLTRIQREKQDAILQAALDVFSVHGFRGTTIDMIAEGAGMSKPNLLYYFPRKEEIHRRLMARLLDTWLMPLRQMRADGDPFPEIRSYIRRKLEMARDFPRESRLFANEMLQGAPRIREMIEIDLKNLVDEKAGVLLGWMDEGRIARTDPYHLIFSIWATTQHYADFDTQVTAILGPGRGGEGRFEDAARYLEQLFLFGLSPRARGALSPD